MRALICALTVLLAAAAIAGAQSSSGGEHQTLFALDVAMPISSYGENTFAWSSYDPVTGNFRLETALRGTTKTAPVPQRSVPFDVDMGPGRDGRPIAVYSRCRVDPPTTAVIPDYTRGRGCDIFAFDPETQREEKVTSISSARNEVLPTIYGTRMGFVRDGTPYVRQTDFGAADQRRRGPRAGVPTGQDLRGTQLATTFRTARGYDLYLTGADGQGRFVARTRGRRPLLSPSFDRGILFYRSECLETHDACKERYWAYRPASRSSSSARATDDIAWTVHSSGQTLSVAGADSSRGVRCAGTCSFIVEPVLHFRIDRALR